MVPGVNPGQRARQGMNPTQWAPAHSQAPLPQERSGTRGSPLARAVLGIKLRASRSPRVLHFTGRITAAGLTGRRAPMLTHTAECCFVNRLEAQPGTDMLSVCPL